MDSVVARTERLAIELGGVDAHVHVGDEGAEHEDAVGGFDIVADGGVAGHGAAVDAEVERMVFGDGGFGEQIGGDGDVECFGELEGEIGEAKAVEFDAGEDDGSFGVGGACSRFRPARLAECRRSECGAR